MATRKSNGPDEGPANEGPKYKSGAQKRKEAKARSAELQRAKELPPELTELLKPPPEDPLLLQLWGARLAATLAWVVLTKPAAITREQLAQAQRYLATLGMLFPRTELVARLEKAKKKRQATQEAKEVECRWRRARRNR
jgi:hypothetical protein